MIPPISQVVVRVFLPLAALLALGVRAETAWLFGDSVRTLVSGIFAVLFGSTYLVFEIGLLIKAHEQSGERGRHRGSTDVAAFLFFVCMSLMSGVLFSRTSIMHEAYYIDEREHLTSVEKEFVGYMLRSLKDLGCKDGPLSPVNSPRPNCAPFESEMKTQPEEIPVMPADPKDLAATNQSMHRRATELEHKLPFEARQLPFAHLFGDVDHPRGDPLFLVAYTVGHPANPSASIALCYAALIIALHLIVSKLLRLYWTNQKPAEAIQRILPGFAARPIGWRALLQMKAPRLLAKRARF